MLPFLLWKGALKARFCVTNHVIKHLAFEGNILRHMHRH